MRIPSKDAAQLAFYKAEYGIGVLAPRGWHCFSTYGSNGSSLFVSPQPLGSKDFFHESPHLFKGPAIQVSISIGDTSGRFEVAQTIARLFPAHRDFAEQVLKENLLIHELPKGPTPGDSLHYLSKEAVEYITPPRYNGEGTSSFLAADDQPITGVVMLTGEELSATHLAIRLPPDLAALAPVVIHQLEIDAAGTSY